jgi:hypothetical protein
MTKQGTLLLPTSQHPQVKCDSAHRRRQMPPPNPNLSVLPLIGGCRCSRSCLLLALVRRHALGEALLKVKGYTLAHPPTRPPAHPFPFQPHCSLYFAWYALECTFFRDCFMTGFSTFSSFSSSWSLSKRKTAETYQQLHSYIYLHE